MPTKSNNLGGRGGKRAGAGRKKKALAEKLETGNPGGRPLLVLDIPEMPEPAELQGVQMPKVSEFMTAEQRDGSKLQAKEIFEQTWLWLKNIGMSGKVNKQLIERYAMCSARWIQAEELTSKLGFLSKHPTTGKPVNSPFVNIGLQYMNQAQRLWDEIFQLVKENCSTGYEEETPEMDMMERLLRARERK